MTGATRRGRSPEGRAEVRRDLVAAAVRLFRSRGYEDTTVDDIAAAAGVGRRTFFRYFPSKEDAISPDHEVALARIAEVFATAHPAEPTASLVLRAGRDGVRPVRRRPRALRASASGSRTRCRPCATASRHAWTTTAACSPGSCGSASPESRTAICAPR